MALKLVVRLFLGSKLWLGKFMQSSDDDLMHFKSSSELHSNLKILIKRQAMKIQQYCNSLFINIVDVIKMFIGLCSCKIWFIKDL